MNTWNFINPVLSGIITGIILLLVNQIIGKNYEIERCRSLISFLRLEIINNYRLLNGYRPGADAKPPVLEDTVWQKVNTEIIGKLPFVLKNHLIVHYYFVKYSSEILCACPFRELERQKNKMKILIKRLQQISI